MNKAVIPIALFVFAVLLGAHKNVRADMTSTNYHIYADSVSSGGALSTSTNYNLQDTGGESPAGFTDSATYQVRGGYQAMELGTLSMSISNNSLNLGQLSASTVSSASSVATITASSDTGYTLSIVDVVGTGIGTVSGNTVDAGNEEYGVAVSGVGASFAIDKTVVSGLVLATAASAVADRDITLTFKASRASNSSNATYSQTVVLSAVANF